MDDFKGVDGGLRELALFAGAGGGVLGGKLLGWRTVCAVERDAYAAQVLAQRQNDGILEPFPIWSDVTTFDGKPWRGIVDVVSAGFPCQPHSAAGSRKGTDDHRWLWPDIKRILDECRPGFIWLENVPGIFTNGAAEEILKDISKTGFNAEWGLLSAADCGFPHVRERGWVLAYADSAQLKRGGISGRIHQENTNPSNARRGKDKPGVDRMANGVAFGVDRLKAIGNGQVPRVAATAFELLKSRL